MKKGFSHEVAPELIREEPGLRADQIAERALSRGLCDSDAKEPVRSLAATLAKEVRERRLPGIYAKKMGSALRYYPGSHDSVIGSTVAIEPIPITAESVSIRLDHQRVEVADLLVEVGKFSSRSESLAWLVAEGIERNDEKIMMVRRAVDEIRLIKSSI